MAEFGTHHATSGGAKPSIFEVLGQENLVSSLRAAFRHLFKILAENFPEKCGLLYQYFDEGYTVIDSVFQFMHLKLKGGLFTETFYGLKRFPDPRLGGVPNVKVISWVVLAVVMPYMRSQLENLFKKLREKDAEGSLNNQEPYRKLAALYLKLYPAIHFIWEMTILMYYLAYALDQSDFHSPWMHFAASQLMRLELNDLDENAWRKGIPKNQQRALSTVLWSWINVLVRSVTMTISVGAFFVQFLEWWYSQDNYNTHFTTLPAPPPPPKWPYETPIDICPLCKKMRTNDTALSSSGFVYCYPCIFRYVRDNGRCPVTGYQSSLSQLVKLYREE